MSPEQITDIRYRGTTNTPNDYLCPDGDLALAEGLIFEDGALRPAPSPKELFRLPDGTQQVFIHAGPAFRNYIFASPEGKLSYTDDRNPQGTPTPIPGDPQPLHQLTAMGNTLIALTETGLVYFLYKDGRYHRLGGQIPTPHLSFGLTGEPRSETIKKKDVSFTRLSLGEKYHSPDLTDVIALTNRLSTESARRGKLIYPCFIRYALRLYDGTLTCHSAPIPMIPCSRAFLHISSTEKREVYDEGIFGFFGVADSVTSDTNITYQDVECDLDYTTLDADLIKRQLEPWRDVVRSVDIFISEPIYTYNQASDRVLVSAHPLSDLSYRKHYGIYRLKSDDITYKWRAFVSEVTSYYTDESRTSSKVLEVELPQFSAEQLDEKFKSTSRFYLLRSIPIEALAAERTLIPIHEGLLSTLNTRELMTDDYLSHHRLTATMAFPYNNRLSLSGISLLPSGGFPLSTQTTYTTPGDIYYKNPISIIARIYIRSSGVEVIAESRTLEHLPRHSFMYYFYPHPGAYRVELLYTTEGIVHERLDLTLEPHPHLSGAYACLGWGKYFTSETVAGEPPTPPPLEAQPILLPSKLYTSEVDNPFVFPPVSINTIPVRRIFGISAATKALSEGQFGQFPLYAFTDAGIWALEVGSNGAYSARQPISRDVCLSPESITQIDDAVLFASERGIMLVSGSTVRCISERIEETSPAPHATLEGLDALRLEAALPLEKRIPFDEFKRGCRMVFDYARGRLIVFNPKLKPEGLPLAPYAYVCNMKDGQWTTLPTELKDAIRSYPEALATTHRGTLVDVSRQEQDPIMNYKGLIYTRPLKLEHPDYFKSVRGIIQRGIFDPSHLKTAVYASDDLIHWHLASAYEGHYTPYIGGLGYKYYRIVLLCDLTEGESVVGCSVRYVVKREKQLY